MHKHTAAIIAFILGGLTASVLFIALLVWLGSKTNYDTTFTVDKSWTEDLNSYRSQNNVRPVKEDYFLNTLAAAKCNDMVERNYYSHYDPDGKRIDALAMKLYSFDLNKEAWAENIHKGAIYTSSKTMLDWYNSPEHRKAMLDPVYTRVGHAQCYSGSSYTMVEVFTDER